MHSMANIIEGNNSPPEANLFCFAPFADKHSGTLYNNLTGLFPFQSLEGYVCFLMVYHYNAILVESGDILNLGSTYLMG
jgi:hypothetical protein